MLEIKPKIWTYTDGKWFTLHFPFYQNQDSKTYPKYPVCANKLITGDKSSYDVVSKFENQRKNKDILFSRSIICKCGQQLYMVYE